jgi:hypothetical protein
LNKIILFLLCDFIHRFILAQNFSIGFKPCEYGGKKISLRNRSSGWLEKFVK